MDALPDPIRPTLSAAPLLDDSPQVSSNPDWSGALGFQTLEREIVTPRELEVEGTLPAGLEGTLYRIGPARHDIAGERYRHWFDGDGMVHALRLDGGRASYLNRYVDTAWRRAELEAGARLYGGFATRLPGGPLARFLHRNDRKNAANTNVVFHAGKLLALFEAGRPHRLDPETLRTLGEDDLGGALEDGAAISAHPKLDRASGEMWNFGLSYGKSCVARVWVTDAAGATRLAHTVELPMPAMVHDFAITPTKVVFVIAPVVLPRVPLGLLTGQRSFFESLRWRPQLGTMVGVVDRASGEVRWSRTDALMMFHTAHAWDEGDEVVVDISAYDDAQVISTFEEVMVGVPTPARAHLERLRIRDGAVSRQRLSPVSLEFPRVGGRAAGRGARRVFGVSWADGAQFLNQPASIDPETGLALLAPMKPWEIAGEPVPVAKPGASDETDAWVLTLVLDARARRSELRVLDGGDLRAPPVATIVLPHVAPFGFHGNFVPRPRAG